MKKNFTKLVGLAIVATMLTTPLAAQSPTKAEMQIGRIEQKSASLFDYRTNKPEVQLRSDSKTLSEYCINYTFSGEKSSKSVYEYDATGNVTSRITYNWENNDWVNSSKYVFEFDAAGNEISVEGYEWENNSWVGTYKIVSEYMNGKIIDMLSYDWIDDDWVFSGGGYWPFNNYVAYVIDGDEILFGYPVGVGYNWGTWHTFLYDGKSPINAQYDAKGNLVLFEYNNFKYQIKYNNDNNPVSIERVLMNGDVVYRASYEYDINGKNTLFECYTYYDDKPHVNGSKAIIAYDEQGNRTLFEKYSADYDNNSWTLDVKEEWEYRYDSNGNMIYRSSGYGIITYKYDDNENIVAIYSYDKNQTLTGYTIYYPNTLAPTIESENNTPIGNNNQGSFDLDVNIPVDSISNGSLVVTLPEGFTLDTVKTSLTLDFVGSFELKITKQENNSWLLEIKPKTTRSVSLRADEAKNMLHVAYKVDEKKQQGTYDIIVNSILFETKGGDYIPEPAITIPVVIDRSVDNELIQSPSPVIYINNQTIYIQSEKSEQIAIYAITGSKLYETAIQAGMNTINTVSFSQGIYIVKGSNGWVKKLIAK